MQDKNIIFNNFCENLSEGDILYNLDYTNKWGEYLLVLTKADIKVGDNKTYYVLLSGLKKEDGKLKPVNTRINLTPKMADSTHFLKPVGSCAFNLNPQLENEFVNKGLIAMYERTNLEDYVSRTHVRKPRVRKYGDDKKPVVRDINDR